MAEKQGIDRQEILRNGSMSINQLSPEIAELLKDAIDEGQTLLVTRRGKVAAAIIPMTASELIELQLAQNPEFAAQLNELATSGVGRPASEVFAERELVPGQ